MGRRHALADSRGPSKNAFSHADAFTTSGSPHDRWRPSPGRLFVSHAEVLARASVTAFALVCLPGCGPGDAYARYHAPSGGDAGAAILFRQDARGGDEVRGGGSGGLASGTGGGGDVAGAGGVAMGESGAGALSTSGEVVTGDHGGGGTAYGGAGKDAPAIGGRGDGIGGVGGVGGVGRGDGGVGGVGGGPGGRVGQHIISIDFVGRGPALATTEMAGAKAAANWNEAAGPIGSLSTLVESDGTTVNATASWSAGGGGVWSLSWADVPGDARMLNGYLDPYSQSAPATVIVTGLPASSPAVSFDVYVYAYGSLGGGSRTSRYSIGATSVTVSQIGPNAARFTGYTAARSGVAGNYVIFKGVSGTSFTLTATPETASGTATRAPLNGLQIVFPSGS